MSTTPTTPATSAAPTPSTGPLKGLSIVLGIAALITLLQALWAGIFLGPDGGSTFAHEAHKGGGYLTILLALAAAVLAVAKLRAHRELVIGTLVLLVLTVALTVLGLLMADGAVGLTVAHLPLAMVTMGLLVWLPLRAAAVRRSLA